MNYAALSRVYDSLCRIRDDGPPDFYCGICKNLVTTFDEIYEWYCDCYPEYWLEDQFPKWEYFSGHLKYPVPSTDDALSPITMYDLTNNMWDRNTEYGRLRWNLLEFLIKQAKRELEAWEEK